jgi:hypothetical protein
MHRFWTNPHGGPEVSFTGSKKSACAKASKFFRRQRNVAQGFYDSKGVFHPIRASSDYSASRAGETGRKKKKRSKAKARRSKSRKRKARR